VAITLRYGPRLWPLREIRRSVRHHRSAAEPLAPHPNGWSGWLPPSGNRSSGPRLTGWSRSRRGI